VTFNLKNDMKLFRIVLLMVAVGGLASVAMIAREEAAVATKMADAADALVNSLDEKQKKTATFGFDDPHRTAWFFTPQQDKEKKATRKGLRFEDLSADQKKLALELLRTGTSKSGFTQATTIMGLEEILKELEKNSAMVRNPGWYFVSIFGTPSKTGKWGWRIEGHHLSVNFTIDRGQVASVTPFFFGANPAEVKAGSKKGLRALPETEDPTRELIKSLSADQKQAAYLGMKPIPEIGEGLKAAKLGDPAGIPGSKLTEAQQTILLKLIKGYTDRMPESIGAMEYKSAKDAGLDKVYFSYTGDPEPGKGYTYRVQGPSFVVEFLNIQADSAGNPANHIHSVWRHLPSDFGL
jgi:hypothetical protein